MTRIFLALFFFSFLPIQAHAECTPNCFYKDCGDDGCGGSCGECPQGEYCDQWDDCKSCEYECWNKECGLDPCGESCGECAAGEFCDGGWCQACD